MNTYPTSKRIVSGAGIVAAAAVLLTGCSSVISTFGGNSEVRDETTGEIVEGGTTDIFTLQIGDCINEPGAAGATSDDPVETAEVATVPCSEPHDYEVYFHDEVSFDEYPTNEDDLWAEGENFCYQAFEPFVGMAYEESTLDFFYDVPTQESWTLANDRAVDCLLFDPAGPATESLKGAQR